MPGWMDNSSLYGGKGAVIHSITSWYHEVITVVHSVQSSYSVGWNSRY